MGVTINGHDLALYHASVNNDRIIAPATVTTYDDWLRQSYNPIRYGVKATFKQITFSAVVEDTDDNAVTADISALTADMKTCIIRFPDIDLLYDCTLSDCTPERWGDGITQLKITLKSSYAYLPSVTVPITGTSGTITVQGNLPSPAVVTLTPSQDIGSVTLTGLTKHDITISNLHAGAAVTIDGEAGLVTEPDLDTVMTSDMGSSKWMARKYQVPNMFSPDTINASIVPDKSMITSSAVYTQQLIADAANLYQDNASNYLVHLKTGLYVSAAKTVTLKFLHDDGVNVLLNGTSVYSHAKAEDNGGNPGYPSVGLSLPAGWSVLEILVLNHFGAGGIWGIQTLLSSQADQLNAYYARDSSPSGTVNKFPDTDIWSWPVVQPGENAVSVNSPAASASVEYKPKFM